MILGIGPGADMATARSKMQALTDRIAMTGVTAVETGQIHAIWN